MHYCNQTGVHAEGKVIINVNKILAYYRPYFFVGLHKLT